jgi:hypothetical protein
MSHNKTGVYLTVNKLQLLLCYKLLLPPTLGVVCVDVDSKYLNKFKVFRPAWALIYSLQKTRNQVLIFWTILLKYQISILTSYKKVNRYLR